MNSISGVFLFYMKEEQSFWATLYLLIKLKVKDILNDEFKTVHLLNYQVENFLQSYLPTVANHLVSHHLLLPNLILCLEISVSDFIIYHNPMVHHPLFLFASSSTCKNIYEKLT